MATALITNKAVRQSAYIRTQTVRVPRETVERRDMGALFMCQDKRVPFSKQLVFTNAEDVAKHFGVGSEQYRIAMLYFSYTEKNCDKQTKISFGRWARGSSYDTYTLMQTRARRRVFTTDGGSRNVIMDDSRRDAKEILVGTMEWFDVIDDGANDGSKYERSVFGFKTWFDRNHNGGSSTSPNAKRGVICIETRSKDEPKVYYAAVQSKSSEESPLEYYWKRIGFLEANDVITFSIPMEDACRYDIGDQAIEPTDISTLCDGDLIQCFIEDDGFSPIRQWFRYDKYFDRFVAVNGIEPQFVVVKNCTSNELFFAKETVGEKEVETSIEADFKRTLLHDGETYRTKSVNTRDNGLETTEYNYISWDRKNGVWFANGMNGSIATYELVFADEDSMRDLLKADAATIKSEDTVLRFRRRIGDGEEPTYKTFYKRYDKGTRHLVDACERLKDGVLDLRSDLYFKEPVIGKDVSALTVEDYSEGDIVPLVDRTSFMTSFYKLTDGAFELIEIGGKTEFDIADNYPSPSYKVSDTIANVPPEARPSDGSYCVILDVAGKTLSSTYKRWDEQSNGWEPCDKVGVDIPSNYPQTGESIAASGVRQISKRVGHEDFEPIFSDDVEPTDGKFAVYTECLKGNDFTRYYFVYSEADGKWIYLRTSNDISVYPEPDMEFKTEFEVQFKDMSYIDKDEQPYVVGRIIDRSTFKTQYLVYDTAKKEWSKRGSEMDIISNYPVSGELVSVLDPYDENEVARMMHDSPVIVCVNPDYYSEYAESYHWWDFQSESFTAIYRNSVMETNPHYHKESSTTEARKAEEDAFKRHGYPALDGVYHATDTDKYYMWVEDINFESLSTKMPVAGFVELIAKEDKNGDGVLYGTEIEFGKTEELFGLENPSDTAIYVNRASGDRYVYAKSELLGSNDIYKWRKIVSTKTSKDMVKVMRLVGADITADISSFRTNYDGVLLNVTTTQIRPKPTADGTEDAPLTYAIPISCRDEIYDFDSLASLIQSQMNIQRGLESVKVFAVRRRNEADGNFYHHLEVEFEDSIGIVSIESDDEGSVYSKNLGFESAGTVVMETYPKETPVEAITRVSSTCNNFGSFSFMDEPHYDIENGANIDRYEQSVTKEDIRALCEWNFLENYMYLYVQGIMSNESNPLGSDPLQYDMIPDGANGRGNVLVVRGGDMRGYEEVIPMSVFAATSYEERESVKGFMFKRFDTGSFTPSVGVTDASFSELTKSQQWIEQNEEAEKQRRYDSKNLNYVVRTQEFGLKRRDYFQKGKCLDGSDISTYCSEVWLKDAFSTALFRLLMQYERLTQTVSSLNLASAVMVPVIGEAEDNGMIVVPEGELDSAKRIYIDQVTGVDGAYKEIEKDGYLLQFDFSNDEKNGGKAIFYRFMYCKNGDIRSIEGLHAYQEA